MNFDTFNSLIDLSGIIFEPIDWDEEEFSKLDDFIRESENDFYQEMYQNFFGKNSIEKEDIIKIYFGKIAKIYYNYFSVQFDDDDDDKPNEIFLNKIKESYQFIINTICDYSLENEINLLKIVENNELYCVLNTGHYYNTLKELQIEKGTKLARLKSEFNSTDGYYLFSYLVENFDTNFTNHNKFSCIYRMMIDDKFISSNLKPEEFRKIISENPYNITIKFSLFTKDKLTNKVVKHYNLIKSNYFDSQKM